MLLAMKKVHIKVKIMRSILFFKINLTNFLLGISHFKSNFFFILPYSLLIIDSKVFPFNISFPFIPNLIYKYYKLNERMSTG